jgi:hypothetical protein
MTAARSAPRAVVADRAVDEREVHGERIAYIWRVSFLDKLFGKRKPEPPPPPEAEETLVAVIVLRRGMSVPKPDYVAQVTSDLPEIIQRFALAQPSWFKTEEIADSMASDVASTFALKLGLESYTHRRRVVAGPEGAPVMIVELLQ